MKSVRFGDLCKLQNGRAFKPEEWSEEGTPIVRIQNLNDETKLFNYCNFDVEKRFWITSGDLLFSWSGTPGTSFGAFFWNRGKGFLNQHIFRVDVKEDLVDKHYLRYALNSLIVKIIDQAHGGVGLKHITKSKLEEVQIPLPSLLEQRRIASILDKADELRQKRQQAIEKLDQLLQTTFIDMFGDPVSNPKGWDLFKLSDLGNISTGNTPSRDDAENYGNYLEWIKSDNLNNDEDYATTSTEYLSEKGAKKGRIVPEGSILVTCIAGSFDCIGNLAMVDRKVSFNQQINSITPNDTVVLEFLYYLMKISKPIIQNASTNSMKGMINKSKFSEIILPIPPKNKQIQFVELFEKLHSLKESHKLYFNNANSLFSSLQNQAFNGTL